MPHVLNTCVNIEQDYLEHILTDLGPSASFCSELCESACCAIHGVAFPCSCFYDETGKRLRCKIGVVFP